MSNYRAIGLPAITATLCFALAACGGGGGGGDYGGGGGGGTPPPTTFGPNFSEIQSSVFTPTCATVGCHQGAGAPQGLRLDAINSYGLLVNVASSEVPTVLRVMPNNPGDSYLIRKLEGTASVGERMPFNQAALPQADIDVIRQWITDGATDDRAPSADPIRVTSLSPVPGSDLTSAPVSIVAMFDRELDVSTVNANTFILEGSGGDGTFGEANDVTITAAITTNGTPPMSATFDLNGVALADDIYRVRLLGSGASFIMDIDANALDGEFSGTFSSGDGAAGGDFVATFTLTTSAPSATLDYIQANVFGVTCAAAGCHTGPAGGLLPGGMDLSDADASFANLVGVSSVQQPSLSRVAAGDPTNSYLVQKIEGIAPAPNNSRMPFGQAALDQATIDNIRQWISDGANR